MSEIEKEMSQQLLTGNFNKSAPTVAKLSDPLVDTYMLITLDQLRPYEFNPRITKNPRYDEIKASIRERGLDTPPTITRRPGQEYFIIRNGGNTRLAILEELYNETKDERYFKIHCLFKPWQSEIIAITGHLAENELRGKLSFIERALGVNKVNELYIKEGLKLSQRQLADQLKKDGYPMSQSQINVMQETVNYLLPIIPNILYAGLSRERIREILSLRKVFKSVWQQHATALDETYTFDDFFTEILSGFDDVSKEFDLNIYKDQLIGQLAKIFECSYDLIALDVNESDRKQHILEAPPSNDFELDEAELFEYNQIIDSTVELAEQDILKIPSPKTSVPAVTVTRTNLTKSEGSETRKALEHNCKEDAALSLTDEGSTEFVQAHIISPIENTPRLAAIQHMMQEFTDEEEPDFSSNVIKSIPVQVGGLYPISDIWYISASLDNVEQLSVHISQLVIEIVEELGCVDMVETTEIGLGYRCVNQPQDPTGMVLFDLLNAFLITDDMNLSGIHSVATLLTGVNSQGVNILSDASFVKFIRVLRLIRRFNELRQ